MKIDTDKLSRATRSVYDARDRIHIAKMLAETTFMPNDDHEMASLEAIRTLLKDAGGLMDTATALLLNGEEGDIPF